MSADDSISEAAVRRTQELFGLRGKRAAVTGGASGLGFAFARVLATFGAEVTIIDNREDALESAKAELAEQGLVVSAQVADVSDAESVAAAFRAAAGDGSLHIAFANAGITAGSGPYIAEGRLTNLDLERWKRVLDVNLSGVLYTMRAASAVMNDGYGRIIVTSSVAGIAAEPLSGYGYTAAKTAVVGLVKSAAYELASRGILVNAIAPGAFTTNLSQPSPLKERKTKLMLGASILHRRADPSELEGLALYLASPASGYVTGSVFSIDGGSAIARGYMEIDPA